MYFYYKKFYSSLDRKGMQAQKGEMTAHLGASTISFFVILQHLFICIFFGQWLDDLIFALSMVLEGATRSLDLLGERTGGISPCLVLSGDAYT